MKRLHFGIILALCGAALAPSAASAQATVCTYTEQNGTVKNCIGVQSAGPAAGQPADGSSPTVVAGSDGTTVRTLSTNTQGSPYLAASATSSVAGGNTTGDNASNTQNGLNVRSFNLVQNAAGGWDRERSASAADATTGTGLLGAGILGQYQTALPTYTAGQFGTLAMTNRGIPLSTIYGTPTADNVLTNQAYTLYDATGLARLLGTADLQWNGTTWVYPRGDANTGLYVVNKGGINVATAQVSVGTTATLIAAARTGRQKITVGVQAANTCAFGAAGITLATGFPLQPVAGASLTLDTAAALYGVCNVATTVAELEQF